MLNKSLAELAAVIENIDLAIAEGRRRVAAAHEAVARTDARDRRAQSRTILAELEALGPLLDRTIEHPSDGGLYSPNDPPTVCKTAALAHALLGELKVLGFGRDAKFPPHWHGAAGKIDLEKALRNTIGAGWPSLSGEIRPATRTSIMFGVRQTVDFTRLLGVWAKAVRADLDRHERANKEQADAAA